MNVSIYSTLLLLLVAAFISGKVNKLLYFARLTILHLILSTRDTLLKGSFTLKNL